MLNSQRVKRPQHETYVNDTSVSLMQMKNVVFFLGKVSLSVQHNSDTRQLKVLYKSIQITLKYIKNSIQKQVRTDKETNIKTRRLKQKMFKRE